MKPNDHHEHHAKPASSIRSSGLRWPSIANQRTAMTAAANAVTASRALTNGVSDGAISCTGETLAGESITVLSPADDPASVYFVSGAAQWCSDPTVAADTAYRWNGVEFYKPGAKLQFEAMASALVHIPV